MLIKEIETHRDVVTLRDGVRVLLRPMVRDDRDRLLEFYGSIGEEDLRNFRHYVKDPALIKDWCDNLDYEKVLPMLALVKDRIVGNASLHYFEGPKRHIAEVRLFLAKDYRRRGLGMKMVRSLVDIARKQDLRVLIAEIIAEQPKVARAFEQVGFSPRCTLEDFFMYPDGDTSDIVLISMNLKPKSDEF
jgi:L-amino acid N-acyltransferase YncA